MLLLSLTRQPATAALVVMLTFSPGGVRARGQTAPHPLTRQEILNPDAIPLLPGTAKPAGVGGYPLMPPHVSSLIHERVPAFKPPSSDKIPDAGDADPNVVTLPPVLVEVPKLRHPSVDEAQSRDLRAAELRKRFPGASLPGQDPAKVVGSLPNYAALQHSEEVRLQGLTEVKRLANITTISGDKAGSRQLRREINRSFNRTVDPMIRAMDKSANGGRY